MRQIPRWPIAVSWFLLITTISGEQTKRAIVPSDCVTVRTLLTGNQFVRGAIQMNPNATKVAYLVRSPNIATNMVDVQLYLKSASASRSSSAPRLLRSGELSELAWLGDGRILTLLTTKDKVHSIEEIDSKTGDTKDVVQSLDNIVEYSFDRGGDSLVFAVEHPPAVHSHEDDASGYRIPFESPPGAFLSQRQVFVSRKVQGKWSSPSPVMIESPLDHRKLDFLLCFISTSLDLRMSPDGSQVLIHYIDTASTMPEARRASVFVKLLKAMGMPGQRVLVDYHLRDGSTTMPFATTDISSAPLWSSDGESFLVMAHPSAGSALEKRDDETHRLEHGHLADLFWVKPETGSVVEAIDNKYISNAYVSPLCWNADNQILLLTGKNTLTWFEFGSGQWREKSTIRLPIRAVTRQVVSNGEFTIGDFSDTETPPQLFVYRLGDTAVHTFARLNSQFDRLTLARPTEIHWETSTGYNASGLLLLPPGYVKGKRYPLVIQTKPFGSYFACSNGAFPSFAPQPIANAGILYLGPIAGNSGQQEEDYYPSGLPGPRGLGGVAEAAFQMDVFDSAVKKLTKQGMVDPENVGIIGFSRTGWYTDFALAFSKIHYRAATTADNVQYSLSEYWSDHGTGANRAAETMYGGPPYGDSLANWRKYSISFNLGKFRTPLLIEVMGYDAPHDNPLSVPIGLVKTFEIITGLHRLGKPYELYFYPEEWHEPRHPRAQLATWQRNLDWYRFWLQGYERPHPEDPEQYERWRTLRELQDQEDKGQLLPDASSQGPG